ncbi:hypothetical protein SAMN05421837_12116 [Amycolatopsis pretoriensis]|uniref:Uncharacterized protein n=1 Tax=Amycolatopsis pretoriensis TaxID=218821 RepID=A0A1H5RJ59_9PSEU|nr:hypothetical protein [Amycolatopsis pretoriensis]SEF38385.1 hypothetical protein SAMN05421837_12116 [Amycolatopsis pretoriensis]
MTRSTQQLVDLLEATHWRIFLLTTQLRDGTATAGEQNEVADELTELVELLRSHADDTESGVVPTSS